MLELTSRKNDNYSGQATKEPLNLRIGDKIIIDDIEDEIIEHSTILDDMEYYTKNKFIIRQNAYHHRQPQGSCRDFIICTEKDSVLKMHLEDEEYKLNM
jgi:hypothetical protein